MSEVRKFSSKPIDEDERPSKKRIYRRKTLSALPQKSMSKRELTRNLESIYAEDGNLPDMRRIQVKKSHPFMKGLFTIIIIGGALAAAAWSGFFVLPGGQNSYTEAGVDLKVDGPEKNTLGAEYTYNISYENKEDVKLNNAILSIKYPESFAFLSSSLASNNAGHTEWNLGTIAPHQKGNITLTGKTYGAINQKGSWRIFLNYEPEDFNSELQKVITFNTEVNESPFSLSLSGPEKATVGQDAKFTITLNNSGTWWPERLEIVPAWPTYFYPTSSTPAMEKNKKWTILGSSIPTSTSSTSFSYTVLGKFSENQEAENIPSKVSLMLPYNNVPYQIAEANVKTELSKNNVSLNLAINGSTKDITGQPGDFLNVSVGLKNTSQEDLNKALVRIAFTAPSVKKQSVLDWADITDKYDGDVKGEQMGDTIRKGIITWSSAKIPDLAKIKSGKEINIDLRLPIKDGKEIDLTALKEFKIGVLAEIIYTNQAGVQQSLGSNPITVALDSDLKFETRDEVSALGSDKETHAITWILTNNFHPVKNLVLTANVYGDIAVEDPKNIPAGEFKYDSTEKKITWNITSMPESVDVLALPFTITMNKKNPTQNILVSKVHIQAEDTVSGEKLDFMGDEIMLNVKDLPEATP